MIESSRNQIHNSGNKFQGDTLRVLAVCSAGLLRSATIQQYLVKEFEYNVRNCGVDAEYALIPISTALVSWADEIIFADIISFTKVRAKLKEMDVLDKCIILKIPDQYEFNDPELIKLIKLQYNDVRFDDSDTVREYKE